MESRRYRRLASSELGGYGSPLREAQGKGLPRGGRCPPMASRRCCRIGQGISLLRYFICRCGHEIWRKGQNCCRIGSEIDHWRHFDRQCVRQAEGPNASPFGELGGGPSGVRHDSRLTPVRPPGRFCLPHVHAERTEQRFPAHAAGRVPFCSGAPPLRKRQYSAATARRCGEGLLQV